MFGQSSLGEGLDPSAIKEGVRRRCRGASVLLELVDRLEIAVPTAELPHRMSSLMSIDHIAFRGVVNDASRVIVSENGKSGLAIITCTS
jgi:hypothetical protein